MCWISIASADLFDLLCELFTCDFVFPYDVLGLMWYLIVSFPDLCPLLNINSMAKKEYSLRFHFSNKMPFVS